MYPENDTRVLATLTARLLAQLADTGAAFVLMFVLVFTVVFSASIVASPGQVFLAFAVTMACVACMAYVLLSDGLPGGRSLGKKLLGIEVIHATTGRPCTYGQSLVRNLVLSFLGPIDCLFIFGGRQQRLGDRAAQTIVVLTQVREALTGFAPQSAALGAAWSAPSRPLEPPVYTGSVAAPLSRPAGFSAPPHGTRAPVPAPPGGGRQADETTNPLAASPTKEPAAGKRDDWIPF